MLKLISVLFLSHPDKPVRPAVLSLVASLHDGDMGRDTAW